MRTDINLFILAVMSLFVIAGSTLSWAESHRYDTGILASITSKEIIMEGKVYKVTPNLKVIFKVKDSKGAYYERKANLSDLRVGERAYLKVVGYDIQEIEAVR